MTSRRTRARAALLGVGLGLAILGAPRAGLAQTKAPSQEELKAAREMFQEAYRDEQEKRYAQALEKFQRVASVKESASVRYRIGSVLEQLGRLREARDKFVALAESKPSLSSAEQEIADNAAERARRLDKKIPRVMLRLHDSAPADAQVIIDGTAVAASTTARPIELDPGDHVIQASSPASMPTESKVTLAEGSEVPFVVELAPKTGDAPPPTSPPSDRTRRTVGSIALGAGGVLLVTGIVLLVVREGDVSDIKDACGESGLCPAARRGELESDRDQAQLFGPLGVGLGLLGLAAAGTGAYLLLRPAHPSADPAPKGATASAGGAGLGVSARPLQGGAILRLGAAF